jgi:hypothetical protein
VITFSLFVVVAVVVKTNAEKAQENLGFKLLKLSRGQLTRAD